MVASAPSLVGSMRWDRDWVQLREDVEEAQRVLATADVVPDEVHEVVLRLGDRLESIAGAELLAVDPYFIVAIQGGTIQALRALDLDDPGDERQAVRIGLERVRQALRDVDDERASAEDRDPKLVVRWLVETLDAPYPRVAELLQTSPRTLQRWLSQGPTQPRGEDAARLKVVAKITNQLRHVLTGEGTFRWFETPRADLSGRAPAALLTDLDEAPHLVRLAAAARVSVAT